MLIAYAVRFPSLVAIKGGEAKAWERRHRSLRRGGHPKPARAAKAVVGGPSKHISPPRENEAAPFCVSSHTALDDKACALTESAARRDRWLESSGRRQFIQAALETSFLRHNEPLCHLLIFFLAIHHRKNLFYL